MLLLSNHLILSLFFFFCCLPVNFLLYSITGIGYYHTWFQWLVWCMCIASMPFVFLCSPQEVLCYRNAAAIIHSCRLPFYAPPNGYWCWCAAKIVPFPLLWKLWKTGIRFKIWSLIGQYLEICVCPWEPARTFCCHFRRLFHWLIGPKLICVNDFVFSIFFFLFSPLACALRSLVYFPSQMYGDGADVGWELCWGPRVPVVWSGCWSLDVLGACLQCHFCGVGVGLCLVFWVWGLFMVCFSCLIVVWVVAWGLVMGCCVVCVSSSVFVVCAIAVFRFLVSPILVNHFCCCAISFDCCCSF